MNFKLFFFITLILLLLLVKGVGIFMFFILFEFIFKKIDLSSLFLIFAILLLFNLILYSFSKDFIKFFFKFFFSFKCVCSNFLIIKLFIDLSFN